MTARLDDAGPAPASLVARSAAGEVGAFEELYRVHVGRVYALCLRMTGDAQLAEELVQESFVRVWQKLRTFRGEAAFSTWLHRLTVNVVLAHLRGPARRELRDGSDAGQGAAELPAPAPNPGATIDLERAIGTLPDGLRTVFVLHDVEGFRHREISRLTGVAVGTSKARLHRARRLLRKALRT